MAKIPDIQSMGSRPIPQPTGPERTADLTIFGEGLKSVGTAMQGAAEELRVEQEKDDKIAAEDAFTRLRKRQLDLTSGEDGFQHRRGKDAATKPIYKDWNTKFDDASKLIEDELQNDQQKSFFRRRADVARLQFDSDMLTHITREKDVYAKQVFSGGLAIEAEAAAASWRDPNAIALSKTRTNKLIDDEAKRGGWSAAQKKAAKKEAISNLHIMAIKQAVANQDTAYAKQWYKDHKKEIEGTEQPAVEKLLRASGLKALSQEAVDNYMAKGLNQTEAMEKARAKYEGDERSAVIDHIKTRYGEAAAIKDREQKDAGEEAWRTYSETLDFDQVPLNVLQQMDGKEREALRAYAQKVASGADIKTDFKTYYELRLMAGEQPEVFKKVNLLAYAHKLSVAHRNELTKLQADTDGLEIARTKNQILTQSAAGIGLKPNEATKKGSAGDKVRGYYRRVDDEIKAFQMSKNRPPTLDEIQDITDRLAIKVIDVGWIYDSEDPAALAQIEDVPTEMIDNYAQAIQRAGKVPTVEAIQQLHSYMQNR